MCVSLIEWSRTFIRKKEERETRSRVDSDFHLVLQYPRVGAQTFSLTIITVNLLLPPTGKNIWRKGDLMWDGGSGQMSSALGDQPWQDASSFSLWHRIARSINTFLYITRMSFVSHINIVIHFITSLLSYQSTKRKENLLESTHWRYFILQLLSSVQQTNTPDCIYFLLALGGGLVLVTLVTMFFTPWHWPANQCWQGASWLRLIWGKV